MPVNEREEYHCAVFTLCRKKNLLLAHVWAIILGERRRARKALSLSLPPPPSPLWRAFATHPPVPQPERRREDAAGKEKKEEGPTLGKGGEWCQSAPSGAREKKSIKTLFFEGASSLLAAICYSRNPFSRYISICPHLLFFCVWRERRYRKGGFPSSAKTLGFGDERHCQPIFPKRSAPPRAIEEK